MAHPSSFYIKYLLAKGWPSTENTTTINTTLQECGLLAITEDGFDSIAASMRPPKSFYVQNRTHKPTVQFMMAEKIYSIWNPTKEDKAAVELLLLPQVRETAQILLMGHVEPTEISERLFRKYNRRITERTVETYKHYFWNVDIASFSEWAVLLHDHPLRDHYVSSLWGSKNQALFRAGFSPSVDGKRALKEAHRNLIMRLEASRILPDTKDTATIVGKLTKELVTVHTALYGDGAGIEESMRDLKKFKMERKAGNVIPITDLAPKGNFSGSGHKHKEIADADA
jgi:hypothetical protein